MLQLFIPGSNGLFNSNNTEYYVLRTPYSVGEIEVIIISQAMTIPPEKAQRHSSPMPTLEITPDNTGLRML
jgi:hypothetical protein